MLKQNQTKNQEIRNPDIRMPKVHQMQGIEDLFAEARSNAQEDEQNGGRHVVIVTPQRKFLVIPCPAPGSMPPEKVTPMEQSFKHGKGRNIAVIAYNEFQSGESVSMRELAETIPFFGNLLGFAYVGQNVVIFEGHASAFAAGCRDADVLIVDGGMIPFLQKDWKIAAVNVMRRPEIHIHDRKAYSLTRLTREQIFPSVKNTKKQKILGMEIWQIAVLGIMFVVVICAIFFGFTLMINNGIL